MNDLNNGLTPPLTQDGPSAPERPADGAQVSPPIEPGEPDSQTETQWCPKCKKWEKPRGKGLCPRCGIFLRQNFAARTKPINILRKDALLKELITEYQPNTHQQRTACEQLAGVLERLEATKPGLPEHQRLFTIRQSLYDALDTDRPAPQTRGPVDLSLMPLSELAERAEATARQLRDLANAEQARKLAPPVSTRAYDEPGSPRPVATAAKPPPVSEARCSYGCGTLAHCASLKEQKLDVWRTFHNSDPEEIARRDKDATAVMLRQVGRD